MLEEFHALQLQGLGDKPSLVTPNQDDYSVSIESSATDVMTDFEHVTPVSVEQKELVDDALDLMKRQHVRLLFAVNEQGDVQGIITAADIMGVKPMMYAENNGIARKLVEVKHIMLARDKINALSLRQVQQVKIGDIILTLQSSSSQHLLVLDEDAQGEKKIRGIISASDISRHLKISFDVIQEAKTFAEIEQILNPRKIAGI